MELSLLAQTLDNFVKNKVKALGHRRKPVNEVVSSSTLPLFYNFLSWFEVAVKHLRSQC